MLSWKHICYYAYLAFVRFEHSVCHLWPLILFPLLSLHSLVHWYKKCVTVHHVPKCMSCGKAINRGVHCMKLFPSIITLINCSVSCTIEWFNWIMVKIQLSFKYSEFHVNYFTIFNLITTLSTDVTKSLKCKGIFLSKVNWRHIWH